MEWRSTDLEKEEEDAWLLDRCEAKMKEGAKHWQCDDSDQKLDDKPWENEESKKCQEALPRLKECRKRWKELSTMATQYWAEGVWTRKWHDEQKEAWIRQIQEVHMWRQVRGPAGAVMCETPDLGGKIRIGTHWISVMRQDLT